jgi:hypothetical protein
MKRSEKDTSAVRGRDVMCAYCHQKIQGTPYEKNGYLYDTEAHANADTKEPPQT